MARNRNRVGGSPVAENLITRSVCLTKSQIDAIQNLSDSLNMPFSECLRFLVNIAVRNVSECIELGFLSITDKK